MTPPYSPADEEAAGRVPAETHDAELVRRFKAGDEEAFVAIVARYRYKMHAIGLTFLRNHADAEEIAQDTFIRAHRALGGFRGDSSLATWLHRIAFNLSRNRYSYFFRRRRHETFSLDCLSNEDGKTTFADTLASDLPDPAKEAVSSEFLDQVVAGMKKLNASQREILTLRNGLNHTYEDISAHLGLSIGTVKSRIARARKNLHELVAEPGFRMVPEARSA